MYKYLLLELSVNIKLKTIFTDGQNKIKIYPNLLKKLVSRLINVAIQNSKISSTKFFLSQVQVF